MILDQGTFSFGNRGLDRVKLLGQFKAISSLFHHGQNRAKMAISAFEALDYIGVRTMFHR
jgi:hypothetical protein